MSQQKFPPGWDEETARKILAYYEEQTEVEATAEDEATFKNPDYTFVQVPNELVTAVRELIARHQTQA
jgi:hypothetical protein